MTQRHAVTAAPHARICIVALSAIADDPRVRRQAEAFHCAGWGVVAVGLPGARSAAPEWLILTATGTPPATPEPRPRASLRAGLIARLSPRSWSAADPRIACDAD